MHNEFVPVPVNDEAGASNIIDSVTDRLEAPEALIRDPDAEPILCGARHNDQGKRVDAKIPLEAVVDGQVRSVCISDINKYYLESRLDVVLHGPLLSRFVPSTAKRSVIPQPREGRPLGSHWIRLANGADRSSATSCAGSCACATAATLESDPARPQARQVMRRRDRPV